MPTVVAADLGFSLELEGRQVVSGHLSGRDNRLRLEVDDPAVFAGAGDAPTIRAVAGELAARGIVVQVVHQGEHLVSIGAVGARWWQRRLTRSRHIRLGSLRGAWTSAKAQLSQRDSVLPTAGLLPAATLWPPAPTFMRRPVKRVTTTHDASRAGSARLVLVKDAYWAGESQPVYWLEDDVVVGSDPGAGIRLEGLDPEHARVDHDEDDEWVVTALSGPVRVNGARVTRQILRTGTRVELGPHTMVYTREEFADHGRPHGGRIGGEAGRQVPQPPRPTRRG